MKKINYTIYAFLLILGILLTGCSISENEVEDIILDQNLIVEEVEPNVFFLNSMQAELFKQAFIAFSNEVYEKDGLLRIDSPLNRNSKIKARWYPEFYEILNLINEKIQEGVLTIEEVLNPEIFFDEVDLLNVGKSGNREGIGTSSGGASRYGGRIISESRHHSLTDLGWSYQLWLSHDYIIYILSGSFFSGFISTVVEGVPGHIRLIITALQLTIGYSLYHYNLWGYGQGVNFYYFTHLPGLFGGVWYEYERDIRERPPVTPPESIED